MSILKTIYLQHLNGANANMTLDSSGRVGIGNTSPSFPLHVGGEIFSGRSDSSAEGGQLSLGRASDDFAHYNIDCYGGSTTPSLRFVDAAVGAVRMNIDNSGYVTTPYHPHLKATITGAVGTVSLTSSPLTIPYNSISSQIGSNYNNSNYRFTAPVAGRYFVHAGLQASGTNTTYSNLLATVNGNATSGTYKNMTGAGYQRMEVTDIVNISAGDYISIIYVASATSGTIEAAGDFRNSLVIYFLG